jgi:protein-disulfide isomerase
MFYMTEEKKLKKWHQRWWGIIFLIICGFAVIYLGLLVYKTVFILDSQNQVKYQNLNSFKQISVNIRDFLEKSNAPYLGDKAAKIVIVEFGDFQCPFCKTEAPIIRQLAAQNKDVKIIFRNFPNPVNHPQALAAALAAQCAFEQNKFWEYYDLLYANQDDLGDSNLQQLAAQLGLNTDQFNQCLTSSKYFSAIQTDMQDGLTLNITATPTFYINGTKAAGTISLQSFEEIIEKIRQSQK